MEENKTVCYDLIKRKKTICEESNCRHFLDSEVHRNCSILAAQEGPMTLQEIGDVFGVSRMRICQIEKNILKKLRKSSKAFLDSD